MNERRFSGRNIHRRQILKGLCAGAAGLVFGRLPGLQAAPVFKAGKARSVIQIWMWGGPSHLDTFDPKPNAGKDYTGPMSQAIDSKVDGIRVNAGIPKLAQHADKYTIIRSMTHGINGHETASYIVQTGREPGRVVYPCAGAVVSAFKGYNHGYEGAVPPYIVLTRPQGRFSEAGFLGLDYKPFATGGDPSQTPFAVEGIVAPGITDKRQRQRRDLLEDLDTLGTAMEGNPQFRKFDKAEDEAYEMMFGEARQLFDLSHEDDAVRDRYGRNKFGQSCLVARRLAEHGVPWVTINYTGWDTHKNHFATMNQKLPEMDTGMSALLEDLDQRGLLDSTIVWWGGEFGRTPRIQWEAPWNGGRGHYGRCFSSVVAGGGFQGGQVVGASSERGEDVAERPVYPRDLIASIYQLMGIDPEAPLPNPQGLDVRVLPADEAGEKTGGLLTEIMKT